MRPTLLVVLALLVPACGQKRFTRAQEALEQKVETLVVRIDALEKQVAASGERDRRIAELEKQVRDAREVAELPMHERMRREHERQFQRKGPDTESLSRIEMPENPSRDQVSRYVEQVLAASASQNTTGPSDPQHEMLAKVGPGHLDVLIERLGVKGGQLNLVQPNPGGDLGRSYLLPAIHRLATADHKDLVVRSLAEHPELMGLVEKFGWQDEARGVVLKLLSGGGRVPPHVISIVARMKDPETYPALLEQLAQSDHPATVYDQIKDLPGIELDDAVRRAWQRIQRTQGGDHARSTFVVTAISHGDKDALGAFVELLEVSDSFELHRRGWAFLDRGVSPRRTVLKHIDFQGSDAEIKVWFEKNYHNLKFDKERNLFVVAEPAA